MALLKIETEITRANNSDHWKKPCPGCGEPIVPDELIVTEEITTGKKRKEYGYDYYNSRPSTRSQNYTRGQRHRVYTGKEKPEIIYKYWHKPCWYAAQGKEDPYYPGQLAEDVEPVGPSGLPVDYKFKPVVELPPEPENKSWWRKIMKMNPGKFQANKDEELAEELHQICNEGGCDDEIGDVQELGWSGLITDYKNRHFVVEEDNEGFFTYHEYKTAAAARKEFQKRQVEYDLLESGRAYGEGEYPESEENPLIRRRTMRRYNPEIKQKPRTKQVSSGGNTYVTVQSSASPASAAPAKSGGSGLGWIIMIAAIGGLGFAGYWFLYKHKWNVYDIVQHITSSGTTTYQITELKYVGITHTYVMVNQTSSATEEFTVSEVDKSSDWIAG
jgi:hypothetical protein